LPDFEFASLPFLFSEQIFFFSASHFSGFAWLFLIYRDLIGSIFAGDVTGQMALCFLPEGPTFSHL